MFTGIIKNTGIIELIEKKANLDILLVVKSDLDSSKIELGASIAHNGVCLTVIAKKDNLLSYEISKETVNCTTVANWQKGDLLNIETSLKLGDELGGHLILGHVDCITKVASIKAIEGSKTVSFFLPDKIAKFIATKGSVTIDGVSLTVNEVDDNSKLFNVNIVPHSFSHTIFKNYTNSTEVNIEVDVIARYINRSVEIHHGK